jgi:capsular polysaccharide biosynthesis protein/Mrp family chromosome partitioning ATPase
VSDILATRQAVQSSAAEEAPSLVQALWRQRWIMLICVILAGTAGAVFSGLQEPRYTATTRVFLSAATEFDPLDTGQFVADPGRYAGDQLAIMGSSSVLQEVIGKLNLAPATADELREDITLEASGDSDVITISATADQPRQAAQISDAIAAAYQNFVQTRVNERATAAATNIVTPQDSREIRAAAAVYGDGVSAVEPATVPTGSSSPQPIRDGLVLAIVGFLAAAAYALYSQSWSKRRVGPAEASAIFSAPILSEIPDRGRIGGPDEIAAAHSDPGDAYRMAAVGLDYIRGTAPGVFLVTSPHPGAGSSTTALNLAAAAADHGRRAFVIAIEDGTRPWPGENDQRPRVLLHDLTQGRVDVAQVMDSREASRARFGVMRVLVVEPVQGHPVGDVQRVLDQLPDDTDLVVIDSPPLPSSSASFVLAGQVDAVVVVVDETTTPADLEELQRRCRLAGVTVAGVVRNHIRRAPRTGFGSRRRSAARKPAKHPAPIVPADSTAPRGLPILTGGMPMGDGAIHVPYTPGGSPAGVGAGSGGGRPDVTAAQMPTVAVPTHVQPPRPHAGPGGAPAVQQQAPSPPTTDMPWSSVTRIGGQSGVNGNGNANGHADGDDARD